MICHSHSFANGAVTGAFSYAFGQAAEEIAERQRHGLIAGPGGDGMMNVAAPPIGEYVPDNLLRSASGSPLAVTSIQHHSPRRPRRPTERRPFVRTMADSTRPHESDDGSSRFVHL